MRRAIWVWALAAAGAGAADPPAYRAGAAKVEITPAHPVRLNGFGFRRAESEGVRHPIFARALALDTGDGKPAVLVTADVLGMPADLYDILAGRLAKAGVAKDRLAVAATHTHTGPMLAGANATIFGVPIPPEHLAHIEQYTPVFLDKLESVVLAAVKDMKPVRLAWGVGSVGFAKNRRTPGGPTDHDLPVLVVKDEAGAVTAVYTTYACHAVTLSENKVGGDWPGFAASAVEDAFPGAVGLVSVGCGADQNPTSGVTGDKVDVAIAQGRELAAEVRRVAGQFLAPVTGPLVSTVTTVELPLIDPPPRSEWEEKAKKFDPIGHHARVTLAKLDRGEQLPKAVSYPVQTWAFGDSLAMVHLPGEVVVDYATRLKGELDRRRVWLTAYANNAPCYIPSERILKEGRYEGGGAMIYYDPGRPFKPGLENMIVGAVKDQIGKAFTAKFDPTKTNGTRPLSPQQSLAATTTRPGMRVDLVAAEPLVADPVALAFGPDGRLWAAEMGDYPSGPTGGRVVALRDLDGDGRFDTSTVFLDGLPFPTGLLPWRKGMLVCAAPDILYAEDADGDGRADKIEKLYSGFGTTNFQARVNGLHYGLDGWVYGSCGLFGGNIVCHRTGKTVALGDRDFRIKPDTGDLEPASGRTQQGRPRSDAGDWFGCDNSNLCRHYPLPDHYLRRNPHAAAAVTSVPVGENRVVPARADAQRFALSGPPGKVTAGCGLGVYRDDLLGPTFAGNAFCCEPVNLVVTRLPLTAKDETFFSSRAVDEKDREFLASSDGWFRPVFTATGPDGGLWVADMYRFLIEHPRWIPPADLAKIDARAGAGLGRVYRVLPNGASPRPWMRLDKLDTAGLVAALDSPNGWQRDMATQMLIWNADPAAREPLEKLAATCPGAVARLHAIVALDGLGQLRPAVVTAALGDAAATVRRHAVRLTEQYASPDANVSEALLKRVTDPDPQVRLQLAFTLARWPDRWAADALAGMAKTVGTDKLFASAVLSSLTRDNLPAVAEAYAAADPPEVLVPGLYATAAAVGGEPLTKLMNSAARLRDGQYRKWQFVAVAAVSNADPAVVAPVVARAREVVTRTSADPGLVAAAARLLGRDPAAKADDAKLLAMLLTPTRPDALQTVAVAELGRLGGDDAAAALLAAWPGATPALRSRLLDALLARPAWAAALLKAAEAGTVAPGQIDAGRRQRLLEHSDVTLRERAAKVFAGGANPDRAKVLAAYDPAADKPGDPARGKAVFARVCAACHKLDGVGAAVGPDLAPLATKTPRYFLGEILDPSRNLDSRYVEYHAATADGRTVTGLLLSESATAVTLRGQQGKDETILRADLESLRGTAKSLMPEGLEKDVPVPDMADLLAYLTKASPPEPAELAKRLLDDALPSAERQTLVSAAVDPAAVVRAMTADLPNDTKEGYRRIPWIWRVSIAAGKANDTEELRELLNVSLPKAGEPLRDWQAVVIGGGVVNGISLEGGWPAKRIAELLAGRSELAARWAEALKQSAAMADAPAVKPGTRYDALRMVALADWPAAEPVLAKYLAKSAHPELQMGAVSGLADVDRPEAGVLLAKAMPDLTAKNRALAVAGLLRTAGRALVLLDALDAGMADPALLSTDQRAALVQHPDAEVRSRAAKRFGP